MTDSISNARRLTLTESDLKAKKNLRVIWDAYRKANKINQTIFSEDKLNWTQGNFSQYLTGQVPIGAKALIKLAAALECDPTDIREELKDTKSIQKANSMVSILGPLLESIGNNISDCPREVLVAYNNALVQFNAIQEANNDESISVAA